jgi:hypothetical protein
MARRLMCPPTPSNITPTALLHHARQAPTLGPAEMSRTLELAPRFGLEIAVSDLPS